MKLIVMRERERERGYIAVIIRAILCISFRSCTRSCITVVTRARQTRSAHVYSGAMLRLELQDVSLEVAGALPQLLRQIRDVLQPV
jgi:hypothetical protein